VVRDDAPGRAPARTSCATAVAAAVAALPSKDPKMAGKIIGVVKKQFGDRADAALVKQLADEALKG
jgi:uncharacterized protein YqeY